MPHDPALAAVIRARLEISRDLDESFALSFMERARLRLELITIVDALDRGRMTPADALAALEVLHDEVSSTVVF